VTVSRFAEIDIDRAEAYRGTFAPAHEPLRAGDALPPGWEGAYFPFAVPLADLRPDGTPARDGVVPEVDLPRRMYAGEDTEFYEPLHVNDRVSQTTTLGTVTQKTGKSGRLTFVDVVREYSVEGRIAVRSVWHDVFLEAPSPDAPVRPPRRDTEAAASADWIETTRLDIRQLFRFSALTFNTHLVHYDRAWAQGVEGLPDLLVHGPLARILMMDAALRRVTDGTGRRPQARSLSFRALSPMLVDREIRYAGRTVKGVTTVTALDTEDVLLATAEVSWA
jgi:3-methylfumaryl-CoA hydratase